MLLRIQDDRRFVHLGVSERAEETLDGHPCNRKKVGEFELRISSAGERILTAKISLLGLGR